jgi:hypothetical protein
MPKQSGLSDQTVDTDEPSVPIWLRIPDEEAAQLLGEHEE